MLDSLGLLLGNGTLGVLCYVSGSRLILVVNRGDLWDDAPFGTFSCADPAEEERHTTLRHGGRIIVDFGVPIFEVIYLSDFRARLSLADARVELVAHGPFGSVRLDAFVSYHQDTLFARVERTPADPEIPVEIRLERFGSRMYHRWYSQVNPDAGLGLDGTSSIADGPTGYLVHQVTSGRFALGLHVDSPHGQRPAFAREGRNCVRCSLVGAEAASFGLLCCLTEPVGAGDPEGDEEPLAVAGRRLDQAQAAGEAASFADHARAWQAFWLRSLMECGDEFLDNLWHLIMYYSNCSQRGRYPGRFCGYLWNWQHDFQAWGMYFHFNQQQVYWPLLAAGHGDLVRPYLDMRFRGLPQAKADASRLFGIAGAIVSDVTDRRGFNSRSEFHNHTPVAQIALEFWRYYRYTGDGEFLRDEALPYLIEAASYFATLFEKGEDGLWHARGGSAYEGGPLLGDPITEVVTAQVLFAAVLEALELAGRDHPQRARWRELAGHLAPLRTMEQPPEHIAPEGGELVVQHGLLRGRRVPGRRSLAAGWGIRDNRLMTSFSTVVDETVSVGTHPMWVLKSCLRKLVKKGEWPATYGPPDLAAFQYRVPDTNAYTDSIFPGVELSAVYPSGLVGLAQRGTAPFDLAVTTAKLFANDMIGWVPFGVILARLGLAEELEQMIGEVYATEPLQVNGTGVDSSGLAGEYAGPEAPLDLRSSLARYTTGEGRFPNPTRHFRFMTLFSELANCLNEMLLQSHDGTIRVAPAAGRRDARFSLHAVGGFAVSAEIEQGRVRWVAIGSRLGRPCRLQNPWPAASIFRNGRYESTAAGDLMELDTREEDLLVFLPESGLFDAWETEAISPAPNAGPKHCSVGKNMLGLPRMF